MSARTSAHHADWLRRHYELDKLLLLSGLACAAAVMKLALALRTRGTNDIVSWELFLSTLKEHGGIAVYELIDFFNHPPFMLHVLGMLDWIAGASGLPFAFWLRLPAILADAGSLIIVARLLADRATDQHPIRTTAGLALLAIAPVSIMVSGFHGNTDPIMIFFLLTALYCLDVRGNPWLGGAAFGMAISIKIVPLIFVPLLTIYLWRRRQIVQFGATASATVLVAWMPFVLQDPSLVAQRVFGYESFYGYWGTSRLVTMLVDGAPTIPVYGKVGRMLALGLVAVASGLLALRRPRTLLFLQCGIVAFVFMTVTPGFGIQYLAWLVPWPVGFGLWPVALYSATSGVFAFAVYTHWSRGLPWDFADARVFDPEWWPPSIVVLEMACWLSVILLLCHMVRVVSCAAAKAEAPAESTQSRPLAE